jgi:hypothetical protein
MSTKFKQSKTPVKVVKSEEPTQPVINIKTDITPEETITVEAKTIDSQTLSEPISPVMVNSEETKKVSYEYKVIVTRNNLDVFQLTVTEHLNSGWGLSGGISCTMYSDSYSASTIWSQAVYKKVSN